jgi:hypothetical protein
LNALELPIFSVSRLDRLVLVIKAKAEVEQNAARMSESLIDCSKHFGRADGLLIACHEILACMEEAVQ